MLGLAIIALLLQSADNTDYRLGVALIEKGHNEAAIAPLTRAVQAAPKNGQAWKALGVAYAALGDYELALDPFRHACELNPKLEDACYYLGRALYATNRFEASLDALAKALPVDSKPWRVRLGMAQAQEALGRAAEAESNFRSAVAQGGTADGKPGVAYAIFLFRQGRAAESVEPLQAVLKRFPDSSSAHLELGRAFLELSRLPDAIGQLEQAVRLDPASVQAHVLLSRAYFQAGREAEGQREADLAAQGSRKVR